MKSMLPKFNNYQMLVSPTNARLCKYVVTDFILDYHSNFQLFFGSLDFLLIFSSRKKVNEDYFKKDKNPDSHPTFAHINHQLSSPSLVLVLIVNVVHSQHTPRLVL